MSIFGENSPLVLALYQRMQRQEQEEGRDASSTTMTTTTATEKDPPNNNGFGEDTYVDDFSFLNSADSIPNYIRTHLFISSQRTQGIQQEQQTATTQSSSPPSPSVINAYPNVVLLRRL
jgi:hypothetical protein